MTGLVADNDNFIPGLARLAAGMHRYGAKCVVQLQHPGRQAALPRNSYMSTNDTVLVMANGASGVKLESPEDIYAFQQALAHVMLELAKHIVQDGERVTKFVTVHVTGGRTEDEAKKAAEAVAKSSLVKSSWNGNDPNWGRIIHAVGYCGAKVDEEKIDIDIAGLAACRGGMQADTPSDDLRQAVQVSAFQVDINLNRGEFSHTVYTTDLSPEYVDFNRSEYAYWNQAKADGLTH